jgi:hypothetical protein
MVPEALASGVDVLCFSGDKLLGGPQAGIIAGKKKYIEPLLKHPLLRVIRLDKLSAVALEAIFARDDLRQIAGLPPAPEEITAAQIWAQDIKFGPVMEQIPAAKHHHALQSFKTANPDRWHDVLRGSLNFVSAKLCREFVNLLVQEGKMDLLKETLARLINQHTAGSELLLWLGRERTDAYADILGPEVFRAMLTAMERDQFNEKRSNRLREFILDDHELIAELTASADIEVVKDLTRALQLSPVFDDMDKRSLLARLATRLESCVPMKVTLMSPLW